MEKGVLYCSRNQRDGLQKGSTNMKVYVVRHNWYDDDCCDYCYKIFATKELAAKYFNILVQELERYAERLKVALGYPCDEKVRHGDYFFSISYREGKEDIICVDEVEVKECLEDVDDIFMKFWKGELEK